MKDLNLLWETEEHLGPLPMMLRAVIIFFVALILLRIGGIRIFGQKSALDNVIVIMLGAVLARGVVGASPLHSAVAASTVMILVNRAVAWACQRNSGLNNLVKGNPVILIEGGTIKWDAMKKVHLSKSDLLESLHLETKQQNFDGIEKAILETNGRISFVIRKAA